MKTTLIKTLFAAFIMAMIVPAAARADEASIADECETGAEGCCDVLSETNISSRDETPISGSLQKAIDAFNFAGADSLRECDQEIHFSVSNVAINMPLELTRDDDTGGLVLGNGSSETVWTNNLAAGDTILTVGGVKDVTLSRIKIEGGEGTQFIRCESNATDLHLENVTINNKPNTAIVIAGCNGVHLHGVTFENGTGSASSNVIEISDSDTVDISTLDMSGGVNGTALKISNATDVSITGFSVSSLESGTVADLDGITFTNLDIHGANVQNGVVLNNVTGNDGTDSITIDLTGPRAYGSTNSGIGLKLDQYATDLDFSGIYVGYFGGNGIEIRDSSNDNSFTDSTIEQNGGYGVLITDEASGTTITGSTIQRNGDCGIQLDSTNQNIIYANELPSNGVSCPVGVTSGKIAEELASSDVTLLPLFDDEILVDMARTDIDSGTAAYLELHYLTSNIDGGSGPEDTDSGDDAQTERRASSSSTSRVSKIVSIGSVASLVQSPVFSSGKTRSSDNTSTHYKTEGGSTGGDTSSITTFSVPQLPLSTTVTSSDESFFALVLDGQHRVLGVWSGTADPTGTSCYTDPSDPSKTYRIWDEAAGTDQDGDGRNDRDEDYDSDCNIDLDATNPVESDPENPDTDGDGLSDGVEVNSLHTNPNVKDTDGDTVEDGVEDANRDGFIDTNAGETNPLITDTDGDGKTDGEESSMGTDPNNGDSDDDGVSDASDTCPNLNPETGMCYYDYCTPGVALSVDQDTDGDGVRDDEEDSNLNCQRDASETDAGNADTDGDGISDGVEDYNQNGLYDDTATETNPLSTDTDSDGITDGSEDDNHDGKVDLGSGETDPRSNDTDSDGIVDGSEDLDHDGKVDTGETNASVSDTDNDGSADGSDICPWNIDGNCEIRYCKISGFDSYDADGDGLPDKEEDSNGDCQHTVSDKESSALTADTDADGLTDDLESCYETNPNITDTDGDGRSDFEEVESSGDTCQPMYNLGSTNPLRAEYGNCSLNSDATSSGILPIIVMISGILGLVVVRRFAK